MREFYKLFNSDLSNHFDFELDKHFLLFGKNEGRIYNEESFYKNFPYFNIDIYRSISSDLVGYSNVQLMQHFYTHGRFENRKCTEEGFNINISNIKYYEPSSNSYNNLNPECRNLNIIIFPHMSFDLINGGVTVQYYLAKILNDYNINAKIHNATGEVNNHLCNNFYHSDFDINNSIVIYCEGVYGNPLNAPKVVRWMLSEKGKNVPDHYFSSYSRNELVYFFNSEERISNEHGKIGTFYKFLNLLYINPIFQNYNRTRNGFCHTFRKSCYHSNIFQLHLDNSFEITRNHTQNDYLEIFNNHEFFICYDPLSFLQIISILCGCITVIYPIQNKSKQDWLKTTALWPFLQENNLDNLYGIAYGVYDIQYAKDTLHLVKKQWEDIINFNINKYLISFINDICNFNDNKNTIENVYY